jgi:hypothetical protein
VSEAARTPEQIRVFFAEKVMASGYRFNPVGGQRVSSLGCGAAWIAEKSRVGVCGQETEMSMSTTMRKVDGRWRLWLLNFGKLT